MELSPAFGVGPSMKADAPVVDLAGFVRAQRARNALDALLGGWGWYLGAEVKAEPSGRLFILAITTVACSGSVRRDIYVCIPSHVNGVPVATRPRNATNPRLASSACEPSGEAL